MAEDAKPPFVVDYDHHGRSYSFHLWAKSWVDAEERLRSIRSNARVSSTIGKPNNPSFLIAYNHAGQTFSFYLWGQSWEDAKARLLSARFNARVIGSDGSIIPVNAVTLPAVTLWVRFLCWWRNRKIAR
jgi:hypothetical protein